MLMCGLEVVCSNVKNARKGNSCPGHCQESKNHVIPAFSCNCAHQWWVRNLDPTTSMRSWMSTGSQATCQAWASAWACPSDYSTQRGPDPHLSREEATPSHHPSPQNLSHQAVILSVLVLRDSQSLRSDRSWASGNVAPGMWNVLSCLFS